MKRMANHRPELESGKSVSQSAARIQIMSHHFSRPWETPPFCSSIHENPRPAISHLNYNSNNTQEVYAYNA